MVKAKNHHYAVTGPLSPRQHQIMELLAKGLTHMVIAGRIKVSRTAVATSAQAIVAKMQCKNTAQAMYQYGRAQGLREAAEILETERPGHYVSPRLRERAEGIIP